MKCMADDYKWMPDMMTLFAKGIKDNAHKVESAVDNVATYGTYQTRRGYKKDHLGR